MTLAKGAFRRRRKAEPPSVPDLFARGETVLWLGPRRDYAVLAEWSLDDMRAGLRCNYDAFKAAAGCAALVSALARDGDRAGEHFEALDGALGELDSGGAPRPVMWAFVLKALLRAGFLAPPGECASCGEPFADGRREATALFAGLGGLVCRKCLGAHRQMPPEHGGGSVATLPPEAASALRFLASSPPGAAGRLRTGPRAAAALERAVRSLAEYHVERHMPALSPD